MPRIYGKALFILSAQKLDRRASELCSMLFKRNMARAIKEIAQKPYIRAKTILYRIEE